MKLSTTTLGCPDWDLPTILDRLREYGYAGVDFRGYRGEMAIWKQPEFSTDLRQTAARIRESGLVVSCISSGIRLVETAPQTKTEMDEELDRTAEICAALDCSMIRVFGGWYGVADATEAKRREMTVVAAERAAELAERTRQVAAIELMIETHDDWTGSEHVAQLLERIGRDNVGCLWDVNHPYWMSREVPEVTWERLRPWIRYTHWKDIARHPEARGLVLVGQGILPLADCHALLKGAGYDGWYALEWEKKWQPDIEEPEVAFPQFVEFMRELDARW